jgi:hypothetical protein
MFVLLRTGVLVIARQLDNPDKDARIQDDKPEEDAYEWIK